MYRIVDRWQLPHRYRIARLAQTSLNAWLNAICHDSFAVRREVVTELFADFADSRWTADTRQTRLTDITASYMQAASCAVGWIRIMKISHGVWAAFA